LLSVRLVILCKSRRKWFLCMDVHYCAHKTNFVIQNLLILSIVLKLEDLLQSLHSYFTWIPQRMLELWKLATFLDIKGNKIFHNIKSHWISIISMQAHCGWIQNINCKDVKRSSQEWSYMIQHVKVVECGAYIWPLLHLETP
jgi:hypothetical protein